MRLRIEPLFIFLAVVGMGLTILAIALEWSLAFFYGGGALTISAITIGYGRWLERHRDT